MGQGHRDTNIVQQAITETKSDKYERRKAEWTRDNCTIITRDIKCLGCSDNWSWSTIHRSNEVRFYGDEHKVVYFHPHWSSGTAGVRGSCPLDARRYYWELNLSQRVFGTSIMFGVATEHARLHADSFINLLGEDSNGWGLSHKGLLWHDGRWARYTAPFRENEATTIGLLYDGVAGTLTYYKDGINLGVAFQNLHECRSRLYPFMCSTAAKTKISLIAMRRDFVNLQDRCRDVIAQKVRTRSRLSQLHLPRRLADYITQSLPSVTRSFLPECYNTMLDM